MDKMYTVRYVADLFSVTQETVRLWIKQDKLQGVQINGYWRVKRVDLLAFANRKFGGGPQPEKQAV